MDLNKAFRLEKLRAKYAKKGDYKNLFKLYDKDLPEITNHNTASMWDTINLNFANFPMEKKRTKIVANLIKKIGCEKVLNIGFGSANVERILLTKKNEYRWFGIDISHKSVLKAKKLFPQATFKKGNIINIKHIDTSFECVTAQEVLEHISPSKTFKALSEVNRITNKGGFFIISVPLNEDLETMVKNGINPNAHVRIYTPELIKAELILSGFTIIQSTTLFAFKSFFTFKTILSKFFPIWKRPNNIIILAQKK